MFGKRERLSSQVAQLESDKRDLLDQIMNLKGQADSEKKKRLAAEVEMVSIKFTHDKEVEAHRSATAKLEKRIAELEKMKSSLSSGLKEES